MWARYRAIKNKDNKNPRYSIFDDIIKETDSLQFQRLTSWVDVMKPDKDHTDLEKETRIVSIKMQRGVLGKENNKTFNYICDLKDIQIEDYVIVEITRKICMVDQLMILELVVLNRSIHGMIAKYLNLSQIPLSFAKLLIRNSKQDVLK